MALAELNDHIPTCAQLEKYPCWNGFIEHGSFEHRWSGWPGAFCLVCHSEDKHEVCLALCCMCPCHNDLWDAISKISIGDADFDMQT